MPAAPKKQPKIDQKQIKEQERVKGLETDEALDKILTKYTEKRSQQILEKTDIVVKEQPVKKSLGTKAERRARRKELQAKTAQQTETAADEIQDECLQCGQMVCRLTRWLPGNYAEGAYECKLCNQPGVASAGVWHCLNCSWDAHVSCYSQRKEAIEMAARVPLPQAQPALNADCPKPSLAWDPLSLTGPHMAIGASAGVRSVGEVALD